MATNRGFFSIIQFCPDLDRLETANLGVVLVVPALGFVGVRLSEDNETPKQRFGKESFDDGRLTVAKKGMEVRLLREGSEWSKPEDLAAAGRREGNHLQLSVPRTILVVNAELELEELFHRLAYLKPQHKRRIDKPDLASVFEPQLLGVPLERNYLVELPVLGQLRFPYAYGNGRMNLVLPDAFPFDESSAIKKAETLAVRGHIIHKHPVRDREQKLIIVAAFPPTTSERLKAKVEYILREHESRLVENDNILELVEEIRRTAH